MQQTTFENIVTKGEISHEKFLRLTQFFQLYSIIIHSFTVLPIDHRYVSKVRFCCGKSYRKTNHREYETSVDPANLVQQCSQIWHGSALLKSFDNIVFI